MPRLLTDLNGATVRPDGAVVDQRGRQTGMSVSPGGFLITTTTGRGIGIISLVGRIYDRLGNLVAQATRQDRAPLA